jgi:carbamate kinase
MAGKMGKTNTTRQSAKGSRRKKTAVVALGGNAISMRDRKDTIPNQFDNTYVSLGTIIELIKHDYNLAITHGNGPQVGNALMRVELARGKAPILPLYICVADLQGGMGYMIGQCLQNRLKKEKIERKVSTVVTQVLVDDDDPDFKNPTKFVGQFYSKAIAEKMAREMGWQKIKQFPGDKRWRRVVASPDPLEIIESPIIKKMVDEGIIVIAAGGGGIPVLRHGKELVGVDAVIDKDRASSVLARQIDAELLIILTDIDKVAVNYGKPNQKWLSQVSLDEISAYFREGQFPPGSMGPKIGAAIDFLRNGGKEAIITSIENGRAAIKGKAGTRIHR